MIAKPSANLFSKIELLRLILTVQVNGIFAPGFNLCLLNGSEQIGLEYLHVRIVPT